MVQDLTLPHHSVLAKTHFNVTTSLCTSLPHGPLPAEMHSSVVSIPFYSPLLYHSNYIMRGIQFVKLPITHFLPVSVRFVIVRYSKPVVKAHSSLMSALEGSGRSNSRLGFFLIGTETERPL